MMIDTNFFDASNLYRAVLNRKQRPSREFGQLNAALAMVEAIHRFALLPNRANLNLFTEKEKLWLSIVGYKNKSYADELRWYLNRGIRICGDIQKINSAHNSSYDPSFGYVYGMTSIHYPRLIKLGSTTGKRHPQDRRSELMKKYSLENLEISFFCEVTFPGRAEKEWTNRFNSRRAKLGNHESREWFEFEQSDAYLKVKEITQDLKLKEYSKWFICSDIRNGVRYDMNPLPRQALNGTLIKPIHTQKLESVTLGNYRSSSSLSQLSHL
jgi:hypothetical protein